MRSSLFYRQILILRVVGLLQTLPQIDGLNALALLNDPRLRTQFKEVRGVENVAIASEVYALYRMSLLSSASAVFDPAGINPSHLSPCGYGAQLFKLMELGGEDLVNEDSVAIYSLLTGAKDIHTGGGGAGGSWELPTSARSAGPSFAGTACRQRCITLGDSGANALRELSASGMLPEGSSLYLGIGLGNGTALRASSPGLSRAVAYFQDAAGCLLTSEAHELRWGGSRRLINAWPIKHALLYVSLRQSSIQNVVDAKHTKRKKADARGEEAG